MARSPSSRQKRWRPRSSAESTNSSPAQSQERSQQRRRTNRTLVNDSNDEPQATEIESTTPA
ncbi:hypothetical protein Pst134EA_000384 [Puccinia striiformis f. sp. tritici]|uniref:hypothetical protein n=1 Tax=Puccinia striiformis f. sp. tritici TaxID=168172 RepID=UPI002007C5E8|nr:hypothetical protein Pst134EA_000384 [Puccinia striiformis f. sp. tritici]KAH9466551.1 hypothetical protein Pst134EB_001601 [Puccinia striiformis f. sp. tritici]KAH9473313.1 hypothetical protein Pst134EA_000384 [Puccinia striiformis f. sp. tritici]